MCGHWPVGVQHFDGMLLGCCSLIVAPELELCCLNPSTSELNRSPMEPAGHPRAPSSEPFAQRRRLAGQRRRAHRAGQCCRLGQGVARSIPADDRLVGPAAATRMLDGIAGSREVVLPDTGHMFRFTHPRLYASTIADFLAEVTEKSAQSNPAT